MSFNAVPYAPVDLKASEIKQLFQMHQYKRPDGHKVTEAFCNRFLDTIPGMTTDTVGNRIKVIGDNPLVLWSCHYDTVHNEGGTQRLAFGDGILSLSEKEIESNCLGADCTAGVWIMLHMIEAEVPGLYIFHAGEEIGGVGSSYIAKSTPELLKGIDYAIAFDRKGTNSVITHQWVRCCSDGFAMGLAKLLGNGFVLDDTGTFTDTANYTSLIPECTNISVGYVNQHGRNEMLDVEFVVWLKNRMIEIGADVSKLPALRDPSISTFASYQSKYGGYYGRTGYGGEEYVEMPPAIETLAELVEEYPAIVAMMLEELGLDFNQVQAYIANESERSY